MTKLVIAIKRIQEVDPTTIEKGTILEDLQVKGEDVIVSHGEWEVMLFAGEFKPYIAG